MRTCLLKFLFAEKSPNKDFELTWDFDRVWVLEIGTNMVRPTEWTVQIPRSRDKYALEYNGLLGLINVRPDLHRMHTSYSRDWEINRWVIMAHRKIASILLPTPSIVFLLIGHSILLYPTNKQALIFLGCGNKPLWF